MTDQEEQGTILLTQQASLAGFDSKAMFPTTSQSFTGSASSALHPNCTPFSEVNVHPGSSLHSVGREEGINVGFDEGINVGFDEGSTDGCKLISCVGFMEGTFDVVGSDDGTDVGVIE